MSEPSDDDLIRAWMAQNFPGVTVTEEALAKTRTTTAPTVPAATSPATPTPTLQNGPRGDSPDADAQKLEQYIAANFPGVLPPGTT